MRVAVVVAVTSIALLVPSVSATAIANASKSLADQPPSAASFLLSSIEDKVDGNWDNAWRSLYPPHQRVAPRDVFVRCEAGTPFPAPFESARVVVVRSASVRVPGLRRTMPGVALEVEVRLRWYGPRDPIVFRHTFHLVRSHGRWKWLLSPSRYRLYAQGACGADPRFTAARAHGARARGSRQTEP